MLYKLFCILFVIYLLYYLNWNKLLYLGLIVSLLAARRTVLLVHFILDNCWNFFVTFVFSSQYTGASLWFYGYKDHSRQLNSCMLFYFSVEDNELFDFRALRLDWFRLQAYTSVSKSPLILAENRDLAALLDTIIFHTKMVDYLDEIMVETSDLSIFW